MASVNAYNHISEPIELLSDDDEDDEVTVIEDVSVRKPKRSKVPTECINVQCKTGEKFIEGVPAFVLTYYKVRRKKGLKVCEECFDEACTYYTGLKEKLFKKEPLCSTPCPPYTSVLNIDSDEEDLSPDDDEELLDSETIDVIEEELSDVINNVITKCSVASQVGDTCDKLKNTITNLKETADEYDARLDNFQQEIDEIRYLIYESFQPRTTELEPLDIDDRVVEEKNKDVPKRTVQPETSGNTARKSVSSKFTVVPSLSNQKETVLAETKDSQDVVAVSEEVMVPPSNLPSVGGQIVRPKLKPGDIIFAMKHSYKYAWKKGVIVNIFTEKGYNEYQLKIDVTNPRKPNPSKILQGKFLAYPTPAPFRFAVGVRVIAGFREENVSNPRLQYYSGVIAEPPKVMNKFRYLVFFDDGCAQYVPHEYIRLICEPSVNPWDDVPPDSRAFIKNYLQKYPERPMVKLQIGNMVKVEFDSNWYQARVKEIDASLVQMCYLHNSRSEWIYRGSTRLAPLFKEMEAAKHRMQTGDRVRKIGGKYMSNLPYVEYTRNADAEEVEEPRAVARKSTMNKEHNKVEKPVKWNPLPIPGKVEFKKLVTSIVPKKFVAHQCCPTCITWTNFHPDKIRGIGPLAVPLHFGFRRLINTFSGSKHNVIYRAPCGRQLRNMEEVHLYLRITKSLMTVDLFDFDYWVRCQAEFVVQRANIDVPDISQRKEKCPISCVNYIDSKLPDFCGYMTDREPKEKVMLNLDPEFLCGCDCTDDCQDKSKCSCWQLTIEGQKLIPNNIMDPNVGYSYRRLTERVITGIYECNQQCKCSKRTCLNRVVQHPLSQKLQLFKTEMKGWGIRCINDIPQGAFICVYAGHLLTEQEANEGGKNYGDEYLAELDYIEVIERIKEDYESDVPEELLEESDQESGAKKNKQYQLPAKSTQHKAHSPDSSSDEEMDVEPSNFGDIRSRLRERKKPVPPPPPPEPKPKEKKKERFSIRKYYGDNEDDVFIMDAKSCGNIGRYLNHSCMPNVFVQNVFVDTHDLRFPWVAFFALTHITAGSELTWDYNYDIGSVEGKIKYCYCGSQQCRGRLL